MYLGSKELAPYLGDKELDGVYIGSAEIWTSGLVVYDAAYIRSGYSITLERENIKNTDYVTYAGMHELIAGHGTEPPYTGQTTHAIVQLTEACKKYKYAKVTVISSAYANYGDATVYFNGAVVCNDDGMETTTVLIDLSEKLTVYSTVSVTNNSSEPTWGAQGRLAVTKIELTNSTE